MIMNNSITHTACFMLALALLASPEAMAVKVYQWTDEEGVAQFSDTPPQNNAAGDLSESELVNYDAENADSDKYSIVNQLEQMTAWRRQAEEDRRAWKQLQLEEERLAQEERQSSYRPPADTSTNTYYPLMYYPYLANFPHFTKRHGHRFPDKQPHIGIKGHHGNFTAGFYQFNDRGRGSLGPQEIAGQGGQ